MTIIKAITSEIPILFLNAKRLDAVMLIIESD